MDSRTSTSKLKIGSTGPSPVRPQTGTARVTWIDTAKGFATFLVIVGHVIPGLVNGGVMPRSSASDFLNTWIYAFHMPLFFLLAGLFAVRSARRTASEYLIDKLRVIAYPYALWTIIQVSLMNLGNGSTNHQAPALGWQSLLTALLFQPVMEFWFLYSLFLILVVFLAVYKLTRNSYFLMGISLAIFFAGLVFENQWPWAVTKTTFHLPFFALGVLLSDGIRRDFAGLARAKLMILALGAFVLMTAGVIAGFRTENGSPQRFGLALVGIAGALAVSLLLDADAPAPVANALRLWGELSLPIFVLHVIAAAGLRIILSRGLKFNDITTHVLLGIIAGLYVPIFVNWICRKAGFRYAFTFGK